YDAPPGTERFSVVGERGSLHSDGTLLTVTLRGSDSQTYDFEAVDSYVSEIGHFADCLRSGSRPVHTEREGIAVLCLILAAYEGARSRTIAPVFQMSGSERGAQNTRASPQRREARAHSPSVSGRGPYSECSTR